jgi:ABC-type lipoprotein export system ATPase subunit
MLISKMHKKENYKLLTKLKYTLMHPKISIVPLQLFSLTMTILKIFIAIVFVSIVGITGLSDPISALLSFVLGYIFANELVKRYFNKPLASVSELNTFIIASKSIESKTIEDFKTVDSRIDFENKLKNLHDVYKKEIFSIIQSEVKNDYELKFSLKILKQASVDINGNFDSNSVQNLYDWVSNTLEKLYKGTRISYWDNKDGKFRLVVTDLDQKRKFVESNTDISDIIDELNLLIFSNHYKDAIEPLFSEILEFVEPLLNIGTYEQFLKPNSEHNENFSEFIRVLLSKALGMQEVLKNTKRQFQRLNEAKQDLENEAKNIDSPDLQKVIELFSSNGSMDGLLASLESLIASLSEIAKNLRKLNFKSLPKGSSELFQQISNLYFGLEKLRFISSWFEDIASYTNIAGGSVSDIESVKKESIPDDVILRATDVYKTFNTAGGTVYAVRGVSFDIKKGEFIGLFGPSGSGKTTLLNIMAGLDKSDVGDIYVSGNSLRLMSENKLTSLRRDKMGFVFQFYNLIPLLKNKENVAYPAEIGGSSNSKNASNLLDAVQLKSFEKQYPNKLSGGQMQRVTIARSLINVPELLFADEPTGDLDSVTGKEIMDLLAKFNKENNTTVILVTHDQSLLSYCSRVIKMNDGQIVS